MAATGVDRMKMGVRGLDEVLGGGLTPERIYLVQGEPGTGKTTLALQFLLEGVRQGETGLYVTLSETKRELLAVAQSHGWSLEGIALHELSSLEDSLHADAENTVFHPADVELAETTDRILKTIDASKPVRIVLDSLSEMRLLARDPLRYRRQILSFKQYFAGRKSTVLLLDDLTSSQADLQLQSIAHGVISLERMNPEYGPERRRLRIIKFRGVAFRGGYHDFGILTGGIEVFPRLTASDHRQDFKAQTVSSGVPELDALLGGGIHRGTSTLLMGPAGAGKSTIGLQYVVAAARRGEKVAIFAFDENLEVMIQRSKSVGLDIEPYLADGSVVIRQIDPAELSPGEFTNAVRREVERKGTTMVVIDSLNGYLNSMPEERFLVIQMHELLTYLNQQGITSLLVVAQHGLLGHMQSPVDLTYLADTVLLLRYYESRGAVHQALSVVKKRTGDHERTIREVSITSHGIQVGPVLNSFRGVLTGTPSLEAQESA